MAGLGQNLQGPLSETLSGTKIFLGFPPTVARFLRRIDRFMSEQVPEKLRVLGIGGLSKSHCLAMLPVIEELAARGHEVTFLLPDTEDGRAVGLMR